MLRSKHMSGGVNESIIRVKSVCVCMCPEPALGVGEQGQLPKTPCQQVC